MQKEILAAVVCMSLAFPARAQTVSTVQPRQHRIVIQLSSNDTLAWKGLMNNLKNIKAGWGDSVTIAVVAHGPGIELLMKEKSTQREKIVAFRQKGVMFAVCENTMREKNVAKSDMFPEAVFVPMGIGEIVRKQEQGWSYIKAGF